MIDALTRFVARRAKAVLLLAVIRLLYRWRHPPPPLPASLPRAQALAAADVIAAEDTRRTRALAAALGVEITGRVVSNFDHNEDTRRDELLQAARTGTPWTFSSVVFLP